MNQVNETPQDNNSSVEDSSPPTTAPEPADKVVSFSFNPNTLKKYGVIGGGAVIAIAVGFFVFQALPNSTFSNASEACFASGDSGLTIDDDGRSMYLNGEGEDSTGMDVFSQVCILEELNVPDSVFGRINNTNSTMGVQEAQWDNFEMSWTYHPDNGLDVSVNLK